ncbi:MAG: pyridoxamine 5'-phosphate oxidase family protein [Rhodospirillales bacterium]|nr:pyridoxamine 5'-phosphate oxidase family protein [Rhodospirillales bacterium]
MTEPGPIAGARLLLRGASHATLATLTPEGAPFVSFVAMATDAQGAPLFLLSDLARHTRHLKADARASLLIDGTAGHADRLTGARLTLSGMVEPCGTEMRRRYLACHPEAAMLLDLADFRFYRMTVRDGHQVAGFGHIDTILPDDLLVPEDVASAVAAIEASAIEHMHEDHADAVALLGADQNARFTAIDADGLVVQSGDRARHVPFAARLSAAGDLRSAVVEVIGQIGRKSE